MAVALPLGVGIGLGLAITIFAKVVGFDRDRSFYPTVLIVIGSYYDLFAIMGGSTRALALESIGFVVFAAAAVLGYRSRPWLVAAGIAGHGVFDSFHGLVISNPGLPPWWPWFCGSIDVTIGLCLAWRLKRNGTSG